MVKKTKSQAHFPCAYLLASLSRDNRLQRAGHQVLQLNGLGQVRVVDGAAVVRLQVGGLFGRGGRACGVLRIHFCCGQNPTRKINLDNVKMRHRTHNNAVHDTHVSVA